MQILDNGTEVCYATEGFGKIVSSEQVERGTLYKVSYPRLQHPEFYRYQFAGEFQIGWNF